MSRNFPAGPAHHTGKQKMTLIALGVLALGTVFLLPRLVSDPWLLEVPTEEDAPVQDGPGEIRASTAAEKTKYRQDAQSVLAQIIAVRDRLQEQQVEGWGQADFQRALANVSAGDEQYGIGEYQDAVSTYRQAFDDLEKLEARGRELLAKALNEGAAAIEALNVNVAGSSGALASAIAPEDPEVRALAARVAVLDEVAARIEAGDQARARGELEAAREEYRGAISLDPAHQRATDSLAAVETGITDARFRAYMSRGFNLLEQGDYDGARAAFAQAGQVYPGHQSVANAIAQADNRQAQSIISARMEQAAELESSERWRQAQHAYESLLAEDPTLTQARVRLIPVQVRADLDERLQAFIDEPLSLSSPAGYGKGQQALTDARGIPRPGPRLAGQIEALEELLVLAVSVVEVEFRSDNLTHVRLYRVADLGTFERTSVKLRPGKYIAAGTRKGFRDVRIEFTITGEPLDQPIVVRCEDAI